MVFAQSLSERPQDVAQDKWLLKETIYCRPFEIPPHIIPAVSAHEDDLDTWPSPPRRPQNFPTGYPWQHHIQHDNVDVVSARSYLLHGGSPIARLDHRKALHAKRLGHAAPQRY